MINFRVQFIKDALELIGERYDLVGDFDDVDFLKSLRYWNPNKVSSRQFQRLQRIAADFKKAKFREEMEVD